MLLKISRLIIKYNKEKTRNQQDKEYHLSGTAYTTGNQILFTSGLYFLEIRFPN